MAESILYSFSHGAPEEGKIIGRLLAGYGELEGELSKNVIAAFGEDTDRAIRLLFEKRLSAERTINEAKAALRSEYTKAGLAALLAETVSDMHWCREIRNQYAHCYWGDDEDGLWFINLEALARQPEEIVYITTKRMRVNVPLLARRAGGVFHICPPLPLASRKRVPLLGRITAQPFARIASSGETSVP